MALVPFFLANMFSSELVTSQGNAVVVLVQLLLCPDDTVAQITEFPLWTTWLLVRRKLCAALPKIDLAAPLPL